MRGPPTYFFVFEDRARSRQFVKELASALFHLAIFIDGEQVIVMDGGEDEEERDRRWTINRLARKSGAIRKQS